MWSNDRGVPFTIFIGYNGQSLGFVYRLPYLLDMMDSHLVSIVKLCRGWGGGRWGSSTTQIRVRVRVYCEEQCQLIIGCIIVLHM